MLRSLLGLILLAVVGGIGFYFGRSSAPADAPFPSVAAQSMAPESATRARTEPPALPDPPKLAPETELNKPSLPNTIKGQVRGDSALLFDRDIGSPIVGLKASSIQDTFDQA